MERRILLLAGSAEARRIGAALQGQGARVQAVVSEPPRGPDPMPVPCRLIDFSDSERLAALMRRFDAVIDASHGFDGQMTARGHAAATQTGLPFISLSRRGWMLEAPNWHEVADVPAAMPLVTAGMRAFSTTGWASLPSYAGFRGACLLLRQTTRHDRPSPFEFVAPVFGNPPFDRASEETLFAALGVDLLICRNLGGAPSRPKLDAAKALGLPVILISRPLPPPDAQVVRDVAAVMDWAERL